MRTGGIRDIWRRWFGAPEDADESDQFDPIVRKLARKFRAGLAPLSKLAAYEVVSIADQNKLPKKFLPYLFYLLDQRDQDWPTMPAERHHALKTAVRIMNAEGDIPTYQRNLERPPAMLEGLLDVIIKDIGQWAQTMLKARASKMYLGLLGLLGSEVDKLRDPIGDAEDFLHELFVYDLREHPRQFTDSVLLWRVMTKLIGL